MWHARDMAGFRVTYATMSADDAELNAAYDAAVETVRGELAVPSIRCGSATTNAMARRSLRSRRSTRRW